MSTDERTRAWVDIDRGALRRNAARVAEAAGGVGRLLPVVKSNAYGVGLGPVLHELETLEPWGYGVAEVREAEAIRRHGIDRRVVILNPLPPGDVRAAVSGGFEIAVSSLGEVDRIRSAAAGSERTACLHLEVDTGMGRCGFDWRQVEDWGPRVAGTRSESIRWCGLFTHFHSADEPRSDALHAQAARFRQVDTELRGLGLSEWTRHICNSAGVLRDPGLASDVVRPGIFLYGGRAGPDLAVPDPVVALRARVVRVRTVPPGTTLGYGATYASSGDERWATVAIGYGDGLPRALGNHGRALIGGRTVRIIGRISMGLTVVDITALPEAEVSVGTVATFLGRDADVEIPIEELADHAGTISYEVLTGLSARLPRVPVGTPVDG